jgi:NAD(P)-dependent dehydrogenase (short-subunit alcohol dehydrogenase family)
MVIGNARITGCALVAAGLAAAVGARRERRYTFQGKCVVITGGSRGLGLVLARQLAAAGARLTLVARDEAELQRAADDIRSRHAQAEVLIVSADVTDRAAVERAAARAIDRYGRIDILINNAGIIQVGPLEHMTLSDFDDAMRTHFWGPLFFVLAVVPYMRRQGSGRIVNISSVGGRIAVPHLVPYSASKFALAGLSEGLRAELAPAGIVVTTVCPGLMRIGSAINAAFKGQRASEYSWFALASATPVTTIRAERAARQILSACRRGDAELVITMQAKLAVLAHTIAPEWFADAMSLVQRMLPAAAGRDGDIAAPGRATTPQWAPLTLLAPLYAAARRNNE